MKEDLERTPFGERLYRAMTHARLSQPALAKAAGVSQGNVGELLWRGHGSMAVVRLARACGVRPEWLAEGEGEMVDAFTWPFTLVRREEILKLSENELYMVEGAMVATLQRIRSPNQSDLQMFDSAHGTATKKRARRKSA